ncbi:MAG: uroporphyrinogen decarboxylase family protein [Thermoguttaceae bacterium]|jgi:uroporphyrinogen decarboxylase|nr:uroporphyrinogen decarboxylase family protein [Thermoguttaceae bacterium]
MTSRELVIRALSHEPIDRLPRDIWVSSQIVADFPDDVAEIQMRFPNDIVRPDSPYSLGEGSAEIRAPGGKHTDAWGCTWHVSPDGTGECCVEHPVGDLRNLGKYNPPLDLLKGVRMGKVNRLCEQTGRFVLAPTRICPFNRLRMLRGPELARKDLTSGVKGIRALLEMVHDFCRAEVELWAGSEVDGVVLGDDWGSPGGLVLERGLWHEVFRPLYREYCKTLRKHDKMVFFQTSGNVTDILGELASIGVDAVHCSLETMDVARLARRFRGKMSFWTGMDQPVALAQGTVEEVREAVLRVRRAFDYGSGGLIAQCNWQPGVPIERIVAFCEQWIVPLPVHA